MGPLSLLRAGILCFALLGRRTPPPRSRCRLRSSQDSEAVEFLKRRFGEERALQMLEAQPSLIEQARALLTADEPAQERAAEVTVEAVEEALRAEGVSSRTLRALGVRPGEEESEAFLVARRLTVADAPNFAKNIATLKACGADVGAIMDRSPRVFGLQNEANLLPTVNLLRSRVGDRALGALLRKNPAALCLSATENLLPTLDYLEEKAGDVERIVRSSGGSVLLLSLERNLRPTIAFLEERLGDAALLGTLLDKCPQLATLSRKQLEATMDMIEQEALLCGSGGDGSDLRSTLRSNPAVLTLSVDYNLRPTCRHLRALGYSGPLSARVLSTSLGRRIIPRGLLVMRNGLQMPALSTLALASDEAFVLEVHRRTLAAAGGDEAPPAGGPADAEAEREARARALRPSLEAFEAFAEQVEDAWNRRLRVSQWVKGKAQLGDRDFSAFIGDATAAAAAEANLESPVDGVALFLVNWRVDGMGYPVVFEDPALVKDLESFVPELRAA